MKRLPILLALLALVTLPAILKPYIRAALSPVILKFTRARTVAERVEQYGVKARSRLTPHFQRARISYPPRRVTLVGLTVDFRLGASVPKAAKLPVWTESLYVQVKSRLAELPLPRPNEN